MSLSKSARNSHFIVFLLCFCLLLVHVRIDCLILFILVRFYSVTMPGDDAVDPPAKIPTLPFKPPKFDWNASNLYSQFKLFKRKVEFVFKGTYKDNPGHAKVDAVLNWLGNAAFEICDNFMWTTATDKDNPLKVLKASRIISDQCKTNTIAGTHLVGFIVANLSPNQNSWSNYMNVSENVHLKNPMKL